MFELIKRTGRSIEMLSKSEVRYIGTLSAYDEARGTITLSKVRSFGSENRSAPVKIHHGTQIYEYIVFKLENIQSIRHNNEWVSIIDGSPVEVPPCPSAPLEDRTPQNSQVIYGTGPRETDALESTSHKHSRSSFYRYNKYSGFGANRSRDRGSLTKGIVVPDEEYDFVQNNKEMEKNREKHAVEYNNTYDPDFFFDSLK
ncbi:uncharacterized protein NESG_00764 [Nematocida ausubeli]|uniref:Lsm14-like N-terminal domain-containing protein n=1 Tax=Nematocida ausubeli (strain ATCC PRA-371 / ERTm2) TaxID=1913371 RepID=A0A086J395_NEMA1|nr:uncharacterized protein NESG_00764 [Nematocida ausubeli]KFG26613.1 hypothetical protein NESG_00764 [Nematocida ausubeli]